jgi:conjugal transfer/entry exclusion protein
MERDKGHLVNIEKVEYNYHNHIDLQEMFSILNIIKLKLHNMAKSQAETAQELRDIQAQNEKARAEILQKIADLEAALANAGNTSDEVDAAVQALKASVQTDDDIVPDAPTE